MCSIVQVALVAINLHGEKADAGYEDGNNPAMSFPLSLVQASLNSSQAGTDVGVDSLTAREIQQLLVKKHTAVLAENYDDAKELKAEIDSLRLMGSRILELEHRFLSRSLLTCIRCS